MIAAKRMKNPMAFWAVVKQFLPAMNDTRFKLRPAAGFFLTLASVILVFTGCATQRAPVNSRTAPAAMAKTLAGVNPADLAERLGRLSPAVDPAEAARLAETACTRAAELREEYRVVGPPLFHNVLVNLGVRQRGLCYQWADDLEARFATLHLRTLIVNHAVARAATWREHNCLVVTAPGVPFADGIVLDGWRHSGRLFWVKVREDSYPWKLISPVPPDFQP
jgi:hypothetical protein